VIESRQTIRAADRYLVDHDLRDGGLAGELCQSPPEVRTAVPSTS
jgi:hypothetical protein